MLENHGLSRDMTTLDSLIFDEADQLLEMGFRPAIENILRNLKPSKVCRYILNKQKNVPMSDRSQ